MNDRNYVRLGQIYQFLQKSSNFEENTISEFESLVCNDFDLNYQLPNDSLICQNNPKYSGNTVLHFFAERYGKFCSIEYGPLYLQYLKLLMRNGADVTVKNDNGFTPLLLAFNNGPTENQLLRLNNFNGKSTINIHSKMGISHFHVLCTTNDVELVELFLKSSVDVNERVNDDHPSYPGYTPLHFAVQYSRVKIIKLLMSYGADLNISNAQGISSTHLIAENYLAEHRHYYNENTSSDMEFLKNTILNRGLSNLPDDLGFSSLHYGCILIDKKASINKYFDKNVDINSPIKFDSPMWPGCTPLHLAAKSRNLKTVKFLLNKGANILAENANGTSVLVYIFNDTSISISQKIDILFSEKRHQFSKLKLTDGTALLDIMNAIKRTKKINQYVKNNIRNVNTCIPPESLLWPGYNLLHLEVLFEKNYGFIEQGVDFSMVNAEGMSPLHLAFRKRNNTVKRKIFKFIPKMPKNIVDRDNLSHLHILCAESNEELQKDTLKAVECILKNGADPNISTINDSTYYCGYKDAIIKSGTTPLHIALNEKNELLANTLISYGANPFLADSAGVTPFQIALIKLTEEPTNKFGSRLGSISCLTRFETYTFYTFYKKPVGHSFKKLIAQMLESHGKNFMAGEIGVNIMRIALSLSEEYTVLVKRLVTEFDRGKQYKELGLTRLQVACAIGDFALFMEELKSGADVNAHIAFDSSLWPGDTALHILLRKSQQSNDDFVELLLKHGADISLKNAENLTPFHLDQKLLKQKDSFLSKYNFTCINPANSEGLSNFHLCCMNGNTLLIEKFLKSGVDVNITVDYFAKEYAGYTPFHFAVACDNYTKVIKLLLSYNADPNICNADGLNSCHLALQKNCSSREAILRCPKVDVYAPSVFSETAVEIVLRINSFLKERAKNEAINMVQQGYELCHKDKNGKTVLHKSTNPYVIEMLLSLGADINIKDDYGKTCIQYVSSKNTPMIKVFNEHIKLLQAAGLYIDNLNIIGSKINISNFNKEVEKVNLGEKLKKLIDPSFSADYFFSEKFVVDYKKMSISQREKIYNFCFSNDFGDFECLSPLIMLQFLKARARTRLLKPAESVLQALIGRLIPDCLEIILNYLKYNDLMNLVRIENEKLEFLPLPKNF